MTVDWDIVVSDVTAADDDDDGGDGEAVAASPPLSPPLRHFTPVNNASALCLLYLYELEQNHPFVFTSYPNISNSLWNHPLLKDHTFYHLLI